MQTKLDWKNEPQMKRYEKERDHRRKKYGRITYDCQEAKTEPGNRVRCARGKLLSRLSGDGSIYLLFVIRGRTSFACKSCQWFKPATD